MKEYYEQTYRVIIRNIQRILEELDWLEKNDSWEKTPKVSLIKHHINFDGYPTVYLNTCSDLADVVKRVQAATFGEDD